MIEKYFWYTNFLLYSRSERFGGEIQYLKYFSYVSNGYIIDFT